MSPQRWPDGKNPNSKSTKYLGSFVRHTLGPILFPHPHARLSDTRSLTGGHARTLYPRVSRECG